MSCTHGHPLVLRACTKKSDLNQNSLIFWFKKSQWFFPTLVYGLQFLGCHISRVPNCCVICEINAPKLFCNMNSIYRKIFLSDMLKLVAYYVAVIILLSVVVTVDVQLIIVQCILYVRFLITKIWSRTRWTLQRCVVKWICRRTEQWMTLLPTFSWWSATVWRIMRKTLYSTVLLWNLWTRLAIDVCLLCINIALVCYLAHCFFMCQVVCLFERWLKVFVIRKYLILLWKFVHIWCA